jgi:hypothetical protein
MHNLDRMGDDRSMHLEEVEYELARSQDQQAGDEVGDTGPEFPSDSTKVGGSASD